MPTQSENASHGHAPFPWVQLATLIVGAVLFLYGMIGYFFTGFTPLPPTEHGPTLLGMELNPLRTTLYLLLGIAGMGCASKKRTARAYGWLLAAVGVICAGFGVVTMLVPGTDVLSMNMASTLASVGLAVVGLVIALGRVRRNAPYGPLQRAVTRAGREAGPVSPSERDEEGPP
jgi:hypothetical protein